MVSEGKGGNPDAQEVVNINKNNGGATVNNATKYDKTETIKNLARSLGFVILNKTVEESQTHYEELYNNFTTNTKSIIDRIANEKVSGKTTYLISQGELKSMYAEIKEYGVLPSEAFDYSFKRTIIPDSLSSNSVYIYDNFDLKELCYTSGYVQYGDWLPITITITNLDTGNIDSINTRLKLKQPSGGFYYQRIFTDGDTGNIAYDDYFHPIDGYKPTLHVGDYQYAGNVKYRQMHLNFIGTVWNDAYFDRIQFNIDVGQKKAASPILNNSNIDIDELLRLFTIAEPNGNKIVEQQFITNYDKLPSSVYSNDTIKTIVTDLEK